MNITVSRSEVLGGIRALLGESERRGSLPAGLLPDGESLDSLALALFRREAIRFAAREDPVRSPVKRLEGEPVIVPEGNSRYVAHLELPTDFVRLSYLKMSDWNRGITRLYRPGDPEYGRRTLTRLDLDGSPDRPAGYLTVARGTHIAELHGCRSQSSSMLPAFYVARPEYDAEGGMVMTAEMLTEVTDATVAALIDRR